ncbi:MAG: group III truncated hemoglobin, partial [Pseudomonadota bacterium]
SILVDTFYSRIRDDAVLGPIFEDVIGGEWEPHLAKMKLFWASVALGDTAYDGRPVPKHKALTAVQEPHFEIWLGLFEQTLIDTAPKPEAVPYLLEPARRIAASLKLAMFSLPSLRAAS